MAKDNVTSTVQPQPGSRDVHPTEPTDNITGTLQSNSPNDYSKGPDQPMQPQPQMGVVGLARETPTPESRGMGVSTGERNTHPEQFVGGSNYGPLAGGHYDSSATIPPEPVEPKTIQRPDLEKQKAEREQGQNQPQGQKGQTDKQTPSNPTGSKSTEHNTGSNSGSDKG